MKKIIIPNLLLICFVFAVYAPAQESSNAQTERKFTISGLAVSKVSKNPLPKANVKFLKYTTDPVEMMKTPIQNVKADENGRWTFKNLAAGEYEITIAPPDYQSKDKNAEKNNPPKLAPVSKIIKITDEDIRDFVIELPAESTISGSIILKGENQDAEYVSIIATDENQQIVSGSRVKDKIFLIENLSEGKFFLNLSAENDYYVKEIRLGREDITDSWISLKEGENVKNVQIVLANDVGTVKGKINGFTEDESALIVLLPLKATAQNALRSSMPEAPDEKGLFEIKAPPGEYLITVVTPDDMRRRDRNNLEAWFRRITKDAQKIIINSNETTTVSMKMPN